jgi:cell division protein FtsW
MKKEAEVRMQILRYPGRETAEIDYFLLGLIFLFFGLGVVMVYSASLNEGMRRGDQIYFLRRQLLWVVISYIACLIFLFTDYHWLERSVKVLVWGIIILLLLLFVPVLREGGVVHPSRRWYRIFSMGFQPSEFAKLVLIIYLSSVLSKKGEKINDFYRGFLPPFLIVSIISFLVFLEPDFSTAFLLFFIAIIMFFIAGIRTISIVSLMVVSIPALFLTIMEEGYRRDRIIGFLNPWADPMNRGYQVIQSFKAFALGGLGGAGMGRSVQKMGSLPIPYTDFIFSVLAEEVGFIGVLFVMAMYMFLIYRCYRVAFAQQGAFEFFLSFGITSLIAWEVVFNIAVVTGLIPATGISLPFLSYGGSGLLTKSIMMGIVLNLSRRRGPLEAFRAQEVQDKW